MPRASPNAAGVACSDAIRSAGVRASAYTGEKTRMLRIYHAVHGDRHYLVKIAASNLGGVVRGFAAAQSGAHQNTAIARSKLGRATDAARLRSPPPPRQGRP